MYKTVIFDLDGTLLYTLQDLADSTNFALEHFGYPLCSIEQIRSFVGNGVQKLIERAIPKGSANKNFEQCLAVFKEHYKQNMYNKTKPYDGILKMLDLLKSKGAKTAVVSNKFDLAVKDLCQKYFAEKIDIAIGESENVRKKPCPDSVLKIISDLNAKNEECVYVGDSEVDIQTAKNAGVDCICVDWGYKDREFLAQNNATTIVSSCEELLCAIFK